MGSHPVEVVGRIRAHPDNKSEQSALSVLANGKSVRLRSDQGYRDFVLDGVSLAEEENLKAFYTKYVEARVEDVRAGGRCTVMMYGPTGAGKSHTMFGSAKEPGVAYLALHQIMKNKVSSHGSHTYVTANVLEIYNEEVFDLLASNCVASPGPKSMKPMPGRARLEVRGRKVKNATSISGEDPSKLVYEIANVEKRRVVKSTNSNSRSSRSHCMVVLNVSGAGGKLILVDMAGSENSEQAGSTGSEAKIQTGKINQGNSALRRVVECIANGDPYIPYRDSKLTMLLQNSFEEDGARILMILCASPDSRDAYKTICTLEYGAKAKCIVRLPSSPPKETATFADGMEAVLLARLRHKDECIDRLRQAYEEKERERLIKAEELVKREEDLKFLRLRTEKIEEENLKKMVEFQVQMDLKMQEKTEELRKEIELELQLQTHKICPENGQYRLAELEKIIEDQRQEIAVLHLRAERAEAQLLELLQQHSEQVGATWTESNDVVDMDISNSICISRELPSGSGLPGESFLQLTGGLESSDGCKDGHSDKYDTPKDGVHRNLFVLDKVISEMEIPWSEIGLFKTGWLPIIPEETDDEASRPGDGRDVESVTLNAEDPLQPLCPNNLEKKFALHSGDTSELPSDHCKKEEPTAFPVIRKSSADYYTSPEKVASRKARIENIFLLCGNHRELSKSPRGGGEAQAVAACDIERSPVRPWDECFKLEIVSRGTPDAAEKATTPSSESKNKSVIDVHVKWESTKLSIGKSICVVSMCNSSSLADLRTEIGLHLISPSDFSLLILGDLGGAPVDREAESTLLVTSLPLHNNNSNWRLACLRTSTGSSPAKSSPSSRSFPFRPLENIATASPPSVSSKILEVHAGEENVAPVADRENVALVADRDVHD